MQVERTVYTMILMRKCQFRESRFKKFLKRMQPDPQQAICMNERYLVEPYKISMGGTLLFRRAVKNRIIEILFYYILIKAHFVIFPCLK